MYINSRNGIRTIKLTKTDQAALEKAAAILGDMALFCHTADSCNGQLQSVLTRIQDDGTYKPETPE